MPSVTIGDPYVIRIDGLKYDFPGIAGQYYLALGDLTTQVIARCGACPGSQHTCIDQVIVTSGLSLANLLNNSLLTALQAGVVVDFSNVKVNYQSLSFGATKNTLLGFSVAWHLGSGGEKRVDISYQGWKICAIQDPGTDLNLHPVTSPLRNVPHLGLFIDANPTGALRGYHLDGDATGDPSKYTRMIL